MSMPRFTAGFNAVGRHPLFPSPPIEIRHRGIYPMLSLGCMESCVNDPRTCSYCGDDLSCWLVCTNSNPTTSGPCIERCLAESA